MSPAPRAKRARTEITITRIRPAGERDQVVTLAGGSGTYRRKPCGPCPWVEENAGDFPAEAFVHSAGTSYDLSTHRFACHESGVGNPATCAGFLLRGAEHNIAVRMDRMTGRIQNDVQEDGRTLFDGYREMAIAHGVDPDDPVLKGCR